MKVPGLRLLLLLAASVGCFVDPASAQQVPPIGHSDPIVHTTLVNNRLSMVDLADNTQIIIPRDIILEGLGPGVRSQVHLQEQPDGFDLIFLFFNSGAQDARLGRIVIGKINLGNNIHYRAFQHTGEPLPADYNNYAFQAFHYPASFYSPVWSMYNDRYAISTSLQFPILEYRHEARVGLSSSPSSAPPSEGPRGWSVEYRLSNLGDEPTATRLSYSASLRPGETRQYVISVRVTRNPAEWIRTLTPYRDYFRAMYGGVRYMRDRRPVRPVFLAVEHLITPDNPCGFVDDYHGNHRPDRYGFRPWTDYLCALPQQRRVMIWAPSGLYNQNLEFNFPFQFTSHWLTDPHTASALDPNVGFPRVGACGMSLGMWWGRSLQVATEWNASTWTPLDPDNPLHVQAAFHEMDLAVQAGVREVGLDTFNQQFTPIWKLEPWLHRLQERYPSVKFLIEPVTCDILHRLAATYVVGWSLVPPQQQSDLFRLHNPFYLADLLVPGHESWGAMSYHVHRDYNYTVTPQLVQQDAETIAANGFVPLMYEEVTSLSTLNAAETWMTSLPPDVLRGSGWNSNYDSSLAYRNANGQLVIVKDSTPTRPGAPAPNRISAPAPVAQTPATSAATTHSAAPGRPRARPSHAASAKATTAPRAGTNPAADASAPGSAADSPAAPNAHAPPPPAAGTPPRGAGTPGPTNAWLEMLVRKGVLDAARVNEMLQKLRPARPASPDPKPGLITVPG